LRLRAYLSSVDIANGAYWQEGLWEALASSVLAVAARTVYPMASGAVLLGVLFLGEPANLLRLTGIAVVIRGVLMLRFAEE